MDICHRGITFLSLNKGFNTQDPKHLDFSHKTLQVVAAGSELYWYHCPELLKIAGYCEAHFTL